MDIGRKILAYREERNLSQRQLAKMSGVTNSTISRLESDMVIPDLVTIEKLSNALEIEELKLLNELNIIDINEELININAILSTYSLAIQQKICEELLDSFNKILEEYK